VPRASSNATPNLFDFRPVEIRMRFRVDVGIHAQRHRCFLAHRSGDRIQTIELGNRFDVEALDACVERFAHFRGTLANARKHDVFGLATGG
jgi:hypothetical protein